MEKKCVKCCEIKPLDRFSPAKRMKLGVASWCKDCANAASRVKGKIYREKNRETIRERAKVYYWANKESIRERQKEAWKNRKHLGREYQLQKKYKLSASEFENMVAQQNGVCAICGGNNNGKVLVVDHDHKTGRVRGLLCLGCNTAIGLMREDLPAILNMHNYLSLANLFSGASYVAQVDVDDVEMVKE